MKRKFKFYIPTSGKDISTIAWIAFAIMVMGVMVFPANGIVGSVYIVLNSGQSQTFTTTAGAPYSWQVDGVDQGVALQSFTTSWTDGGLHYVVGFYNGGADYNQWRVSVQRTLASTPVPTINQTPYLNIKASVRSYDFPGILTNSIVPYTNIMGTLFWLFVWLMIFCAYWIRQRQVTFPTIIALIFGGVIIGTLPEEYQIYAKGLIAVGAFAVLYMFFTERRQ